MKLKAEIVDELVPKELQDLVLHFFITFSRFEYALKRASYITPAAEPAWDEFAKKHEQAFASGETPALRAACKYFEARPPRKQILAEGSLGWSPSTKRTTEPELVWLLCMVRRVRNNLFHGGKFPLRPIPEPSRNVTLLAHALTMLDACLQLDKNVSNYFHNPLV